jgi:hypothetical protein
MKDGDHFDGKLAPKNHLFGPNQRDSILRKVSNTEQTANYFEWTLAYDRHEKIVTMHLTHRTA